MDTFLSYWAEDGDDSLDTFETEQEAVDCLEEWIERRRDDADDEGWPLGMRGYVARLTHRVQEYETKAPEGSSFETCCDYAVKSLPDPRDARIVFLEAENAGLKARVSELEASIEREATYQRERQERLDRLAGVP